MEQMTLALNDAREKKTGRTRKNPSTAARSPSPASRGGCARGGGTETVYRLVNRDKTKIGVISHAPNCGYTDAELKSLAAKGWKLKVEVRAV